MSELLTLSNLSPKPGSRKATKRLGRGIGSGQGKTGGRGTKGGGARSGYSVPVGFEGGQMPLIRRLPKFGFKNPTRVEYQIINVSDLDVLAAGTEVSPDSLAAMGAIGSIAHGPLKVLGNGQLTKKLTVKAQKISKGARTKIEAAGGTVEILEG